MPILNSGLVHPIISTFKQLAITNMQIDTQMPNQMVDVYNLECNIWYNGNFYILYFHSFDTLNQNGLTIELSR